MSDSVVAPPRKTRHQKKKTPRPDLRHWPKSWEFTIRAATNADGETVHELVDAMTQQYGYTLPQCRWDNIAPFWYVAELSGLLIGAVQICIGRPIGRMELLATHAGLSNSQRAKVVKALIYRAALAMQMDGTTFATGVIPEAHEDFMRIVERLGARYATKGKLYVFPLATEEMHDGVL